MDASKPLRVWAPLVERLDVVTDDGPTPLVRGDDGWHDGPRLAPGTRYRLRTHDGPGGEREIGDPASHSQPEGVFGPSEAVDHDAFPWTDDDWTGEPNRHLDRAVIYELHVGTYTPEGTFDAAIAHLPELVDLGITHVELLPVNTFTGTFGWGYDGVFWFAPHHAYGGVDGLKRFVDAAHRLGLAVVLDAVYNHLGPEGDVTWCLGPIRHDAHHTPWGEAINLDGEHSDGVRRTIVDSAITWLDRYHLDGLRLDAVFALVDDSPTHLLTELSDACHELGERTSRPRWLVAESEHQDLEHLTPGAEGGHGLDAQWADDLHHVLHTGATGEDRGYYARYRGLDQLADVLANPFVRTGFDAGTTPGTCFVVCGQNHDQIGNRAQGDRISHLVGPERAMAIAAVVAFSGYVPLLFQGEEWAASTPWPFFADPQDEGLAEAIRAGRTREFEAFGWDPDEIPNPVSEATACSAVLDRSERERDPHAGTLAFYRSLLALRRTDPDLGATGRKRIHVSVSGDRVITLERGELRLAASLGERPADAEGEVVLRSPGGFAVVTRAIRRSPAHVEG
jgi:maltooligosyltrehalose trehalohydrolase